MFMYALFLQVETLFKIRFKTFLAGILNFFNHTQFIVKD